MLHYALPCLLCIAGLAVAQAPNCDSYLICQSNLNDALNLTNPQPWFSPEEFRHKVEQYYQNQGAFGLRTVCKAFRQFKGCMGAEYSSCMSAGHFVTASVPIFETYQFISIFNQMHYVCGGGFQIYMDNDDCMSKAWGGETGNQLNACRYKFEKNSDASSEDAQTVKYLASTYLSCFEEQFKETCGVNSRDSQFWGCEYARVNVFTRFPQTDVGCVLPYAGGIIG
ncbi:hypothetical protein GCK32_000367 [Trichostrongylus colubriformis]|uniref:Uncharacterized protein n=1 Tax=Trichostrongylus colubriformis TaxID=6319 RepID=A0AAN8FY84_TRICO